MLSLMRQCSSLAPAIANISPLRYSLLNPASRSTARYSAGVNFGFGAADMRDPPRRYSTTAAGSFHGRRRPQAGPFGGGVVSSSGPLSTAGNTAQVDW